MFEQRTDLVGPVEQAVLRMNVQVNEAQAKPPQPLKTSAWPSSGILSFMAQPLIQAGKRLLTSCGKARDRTFSASRD
jgi:hypothetical protein